MKKQVPIMIALLLITVGSVYGQVTFEPLTPQFKISQSASGYDVIIENTGNVKFHFQHLGLGSPGQTFPAVVLYDDSSVNVVSIGEWYSANNICYFLIDSVLQVGGSMEFQLTSSDGSLFSIREAEVFARIGDNTTNKKVMSTGDSIVLQSCYGGTTNIVEGVVQKHDINIYPNPTSDFINISCSKEKEIEIIRILNLLGEMVLETTDPQRIDISHLPEGTYFIQLKFPFGEQVKKMILQH